MKKLFIFITVSFLFGTAFSQELSLNNFIRLEAKGSLPKELSDIANGKIKAKDRHQEIVNQQIKDIVLSGRIIFGDTVSNYVNKIVDRLLADEPELRKNIKVYIIKSSQANAFATSEGYIFLTVGFIAQATSEAELGYVISHELIHYVKKHGYNLKDEEEFDNISDFLKYHSRSREQEFECDRLGYENYFKKSGYSQDAVNGVFDILQYSYLPFDEVKISRDIYETEYYKFKDNYFLTSVTPIASRENYIDTFSTHPNLKSRRLEMEKFIEKDGDLNGSNFIQSKEDFNFIRSICRFETINQQIIEDNYLKSYYNSLILKREFPNNKFLETANSTSLFGIAMSKIGDSFQDIDLKAEDTEGEIQFTTNLFRKISKKEIALLSIRSTWENIKKYPQDKYYKQMFKEVLKPMIDDWSIGTLNKFSDYKMGETPIIDSSADENKAKSKYDKIRQNKLVGNQKSFKVENYMLADLKKDSSFVKCFENLASELEASSANNLISSIKSSSEIKEESNNKLLTKEKLIILKPYAEKKGNSNSKRETIKLEKIIKNTSSLNGFEPVIISRYQKEINIDYQILSRLNDYSRSINKYSQLTYESRDAQELSKQLGSPLLNLVYCQREKCSSRNTFYKFFHLGFSAFSWPTLPFSIVQWFQGQYTTSLSFVTYNLETDQLIYSTNLEFEHENTNDETTQKMYECYFKTKQLNNKK